MFHQLIQSIGRLETSVLVVSTIVTGGEAFIKLRKAQLDQYWNEMSKMTHIRASSSSNSLNGVDNISTTERDNLHQSSMHGIDDSETKLKVICIRDGNITRPKHKNRPQRNKSELKTGEQVDKTELIFLNQRVQDQHHFGNDADSSNDGFKLAPFDDVDEDTGFKTKP